MRTAPGSEGLGQPLGRAVRQDTWWEDWMAECISRPYERPYMRDFSQALMALVARTNSPKRRLCTTPGLEYNHRRHHSSQTTFRIVKGLIREMSITDNTSDEIRANDITCGSHGLHGTYSEIYYGLRYQSSATDRQAGRNEFRLVSRRKSLCNLQTCK